jgi:hypothetical protein
VLHGAQRVARGAIAASAVAGQAQLALVNGSVGIIAVRAGRPQVVLNMTVNAARRITRIEIVADPARLRRLRLAVLPD